MSSPQKEVQVSQQLADLIQYDLQALRRRWRALTGRQAPEHLPKQILLRILAYRIQAESYGDLDSRSAKVLQDISKQRRLGTFSAGVPTLESLELSLRGTRKLAPGTVIGREHGGTMHHVMVLAEGFSWNGKTYRSLSEVAFAITGTRWNGPRFFGLKQARMRGTREGGAS